MTPKEALESIGKGTKTIVKIGYGKDNTSYLETCTIKDTKEYTVVSKALTELEELKRDVKRYFDLGHIEEPSTEQFEEYLKLTDKLLKVGNEE